MNIKEIEEKLNSRFKGKIEIEKVVSEFYKISFYYKEIEFYFTYHWDNLICEDQNIYFIMESIKDYLFRYFIQK